MMNLSIAKRGNCPSLAVMKARPKSKERGIVHHRGDEGHPKEPKGETVHQKGNGGQNHEQKPNTVHIM